MRRRLKEITPNIYSEKLFVESLSDSSIGPLAQDIQKNGLRHPLRVTRVGVVVIDGERRRRACAKLGWADVEVIEEDVRRVAIFDLLMESVASGRQMTLLEQARVYSAFYLHLKRAHRKGDMNHIAAKQIAMRVARLPFRSVTMADQLALVVTSGEPDLHEKLLRGEMSLTGAYERMIRRQFGKPEPVVKSPPTADQIAKTRAREAERREQQTEREFTQRYIAAHADELAALESQRKLLALYEPDPAPRSPKFRDNEESQLIAEAFEALAVKEVPEKLVGRLASFIESILESIKEVDEQRSRDIVRGVVKPMVLRLAHAFPRREFEVPMDTEQSPENAAVVESLTAARGGR